MGVKYSSLLTNKEQEELRNRWGEKYQAEIEAGSQIFLKYGGSDGYMSKSDFGKLFGLMSTSTTPIANFLFDVMDARRDNSISFYQFITFVLTLSFGTPEDQMRIAFQLMDLFQHNKITKTEIQVLVNSIFGFLSSLSVEMSDQQTFVNEFCEILGLKDVNDEITAEEYKERCLKNDVFLQTLGDVKDRSDLILNGVTMPRIENVPGKLVSFGHDKWDFVLSLMLGLEVCLQYNPNYQSTDGSLTPHATSTPQVSHDNDGKQMTVGTIVTESNVSDPFKHQRKRVIFIPAGSFALNKKINITEYSPNAFREIRKSFDISEKNFIHSLGIRQVLGNLLIGNLSTLSSLASEGKSGSFFYYSPDARFMLKTVTANEKETLLNILKDYHNYVCKCRDTLLTRIFGFYKFSTSGESRRFIIMGNVFNTNKIIHQRFDLKGSTFGRTSRLNHNLAHNSLNSPSANRSRSPSYGGKSELKLSSENHPIELDSVVLKDLDFIQLKRSINVGPKKAKMLIEQIKRDTRFLQNLKIIDYSMLLGIHRTNRDVIKEKRLWINARKLSLERMYKSLKENNEHIKMDGLKFIDFCHFVYTHCNESTERVSFDRSIFQSDHGGMNSYRTSDDGYEIVGEEILFVGIIDILITFGNISKKSEHYLRSPVSGGDEISVIPPEHYGPRFVKFVTSAVT